MSASTTAGRTDDADAAARIRDAAIDAFAAHGFEGASVRRIATAAGVSPALVLHHFGSKEGLRAACDAHVVGRLIAAKAEVPADQLLSPSPAVIAATLEGGGGAVAWRYMAHMLMDRTEHGGDLFASLVATTRAALTNGWPGITMDPGTDPEAMAVVMTIDALAPMLLAPHAAQALGLDPSDPAALLQRLGPSLLHLYTSGILRGPAADPAHSTKDGR